MRTFKNIFGVDISIKPFFHTACDVWRVSRYENNELETVYENEGFERYIDCVIACEEHFNKIN